MRADLGTTPIMSPDDPLQRLRAAAPAVLPSMLMCDFGNLEREVRQLEDAGVVGLHLDVMDGNFVPNMTYGLPIVSAIRGLTSLVLDVHLMISDPATYGPQFSEAGADVITFHAEAVDEPREVLEIIQRSGASAGVAINPPTQLAAIESCIDLCDLILVMSVMPGFGGQSFEPVALEKLKQLSQRDDCRALLEIDGGVNDATIAACAEAGAELFVVGSGIFRSNDYRDRVQTLNRELRSQVS